jgi:hypothetical protein
MKLSERLAAATELTIELREEMARMLGWTKPFTFWGRPATGERSAMQPPKYDLTEIVAEIERRGWGHSHLVWPRLTASAEFTVNKGRGDGYFEATRPITRLTTNTAMTALQMNSTRP